MTKKEKVDFVINTLNDLYPEIPIGKTYHRRN